MGKNQRREIHRWEFDPLCPLDFRFRDAQHLAESKPTQWADDDDSLVLDCAAFLRALNSAETGRERVAARARFPLIRATVDFAEEHTLRRAEVQARLLAGQTDRQIAARCKIRPKLVGSFEQLHFAVRHCLRATDYLQKQVVGSCRWEGFKSNQVAEFWSLCALGGGVVAVDFFVGRLKDVLRPGDQPSLLAYFDRRIPLRVQGFVAAHVVPFNEQMGAVWNQCQSRLSKAKGDDAEYVLESDTQQRVLIRLARAHLMGKPLPIRPLATTQKSPETPKVAANRGGAAPSPKTRRTPTLRDVEALLAEMGIKV